MAQKKSQSELQKKVLLLGQIPGYFAKGAMDRFAECAKAQTELYEKFQETNKQWLDRVQAEAKLASEFVSKLSSARSIPDAMIVCQEWGTRRFEMIAEDAKHVLDDTQKLIRTGAHMVTNGFASKGDGIST